MQFIDAINLEVFVAEENAPLLNLAIHLHLCARYIASIFFACQPPQPLLKEYFRRGLITRLRKAKMSDTMLESLVFVVVFFFQMQRTPLCIVSSNLAIVHG
jgi:hypothetical protein